MDKLPSSKDYNSADQPQSSEDPNSLKGLTGKTYSGTSGFNYTTGGKTTVGAELDKVDAGQLVNVTKGVPDSSTTGFACKKDMHIGNLINITGPQTMNMDDVAPWLSLLRNQAGAPARPEKVKGPPARTHDHTDHEDIIIRIEERMADMPAYYDLPLKEFFRPNLSRLYATTGEGINRLISGLQEMGELHDDTLAELEAMNTDKKRCQRVYDIIAQKEALRPLILALEQSDNKHVIDLMRKLAANFESGLWLSGQHAVLQQVEALRDGGSILVGS